MADDERYYAYGAPKTSTTTPSVRDAFQTITNNGDLPVNLKDAMDLYEGIYGTRSPEGGSTELISGYRKFLEDSGGSSWMDDLMSMFAGLGSGSGSGSNRQGYKNAAQILLQLRGKDPYAGLRSALERNAAAARTTGDSAVAALRAALQQRQNPYAGIQFNTPMAAANPLAAYMEQTGSSTGQVDALRDLLGSWSANAAAADQEMASRLGTSWQNDQTSRLSDADTTAAAFQQALASNLATQQGALDTQTQQYYADLTRQLADLAIQSGLSLADLGVTL